MPSRHAERPDRLSRRDALARLGLGAASLPLLPGLQEPRDPAPPRRTPKLGVGYRKLGRTGLETSEIIVGTVQIRPSNARILRAAIEQGITYIDTAPAYGNGQSETAVGRVVDEMKCRGRVLIATKASGFPHGRMRRESDAKVEAELRRFLEASLGRLRTDHADVYFLHHGARNPDLLVYPQLLKAADKLRKEGKIRATAVSTHTNYRAVAEAVVRSGAFDVLMPVLNAPNTDPEIAKAARERGARRGRRLRRSRGPIQDMRDVVATCKEKGIGLIAMKAAQPPFFPGATWDASVAKYGKDRELSDHQALYRKILLDDVAAVNVGMGRMSYLDEALALSEALRPARKRRRG